MTEAEVLKKLDYFKEAIKRLKQEKDYWQQKAEENYEILFANAEMLKEDNDKLKQENLELKSQVKAKQEDSGKKYTEEDLKKFLAEINKKSKEKILTLQKANKDYEATCDKLREENNGLEITNKNLERRLKEITAEKEIDQVLHGEITESEIDEILTKPVKVVKLDV